MRRDFNGYLLATPPQGLHIAMISFSRAENGPPPHGYGFRAPRCERPQNDARSISHDTQACVRKVPAVLAPEESEDRQAAQSRRLCEPRRRREAQARRAVFQAALRPSSSPVQTREGDRTKRGGGGAGLSG